MHIPPAALDAAADGFARNITDDDVCADLGPTSDPGMHRYLIDAHVLVPTLGELLPPRVGRVIETYYRSPWRVRTVRAYRNRAAVCEQELPSSAWHLDPEITCDLRYFVYLNDTTTADAALETVDRARTRRALLSGYVDRGRVQGPARRLVDESAVAHEGPRGTALLIDAQRTLHRAGTCAPGHHRDIAQFWITPAAHRHRVDWFERLPPDPTFHGGMPGDG